MAYEFQLGIWLIAVLALLAVASFPIYSYSRKRGYGPGGAFLAVLLISMGVMFIAGIAWWPWGRVP
jgi:FtsH-binding integral membrane protein